MFGRKKNAAVAEAPVQEAGPVEGPEAPAPEQAGVQEEGEAAQGTPSLSEADRRRAAAGAKLVSAAFGEITTLLMRAPGYKHYTLSDLEWLVLPPLLANQFTLAEARSKETGLSAPVGVALWARVSPETDARLSSALDAPIRLRPDEWQGGDILWLIDAVGPPKIVQALLQRLRTQDFKGRGFKLRARDENGKPVVKEIPAAEESRETGSVPQAG